jgi:hypothetical protein
VRTGRGIDYYFIDLIPSVFACNVCKLRLHGQQELVACDLPSSRMDVVDYQLGPEFDPLTAAEAMYGTAIRGAPAGAALSADIEKVVHGAK